MCFSVHLPLTLTPMTTVRFGDVVTLLSFFRILELVVKPKPSRYLLVDPQRMLTDSATEVWPLSRLVKMDSKD